MVGPRRPSSQDSRWKLRAVDACDGGHGRQGGRMRGGEETHRRPCTGGVGAVAGAAFLQRNQSVHEGRGPQGRRRRRHHRGRNHDEDLQSDRRIPLTRVVRGRSRRTPLPGRPRHVGRYAAPRCLAQCGSSPPVAGPRMGLLAQRCGRDGSRRTRRSGIPSST